MDEPRPEVRVGDRERRAVDDRLQRAYADGVLTMTEYEERSAQCWAARTRGDLEPLVSDLPEPAPPSTAAASATMAVEPVAADRRPARSGHRRVLGAAAAVVLAGGGLFGATRALSSDDALSVFGNQIVTVAPGDDQVEVGVVFGRVRVIVPADARVQPGGTLIFGNTECNAACDGTGQRDVAVQSSGAFGNVTIQRQGESDPDRDRDEGDRRDDRDDD